MLPFPFFFYSEEDIAKRHSFIMLEGASFRKKW